MPLDIRDTHSYTRLGETRDICKAATLPKPVIFKNYRVY